MKVRRKGFALFVSVLTALTMTVPFVGCGGGETPTGCTHNWVAATCTEPERCTICNETRGEAAGHKYVDSITPATCDADGHKDRECSVCHDKIAERIPQLSHKYVSSVEKGDCETDTVTTYTCELCKEAYSEVTERHKGHDFTDVTWTETDEKEGDSPCEFIITETAKCKTCKEDIERTYHKHVFVPTVKYDDETGKPIVVKPTCDKAGYIPYACACGNPEYDYNEVLPIDINAHKWQTVSGRDDITDECSECHATKAKVVPEADGTISAAAIAGKQNVEIAVKDTVKLQPDASLTSKMQGGVKVSAEEVEVPSAVKGDDATILKDAQVYNFELKDTSDNNIAFDGGKMKISLPIPTGNDPEATDIAACYIADDGSVEYMEADVGFISGTVTFEAEHFSHYTVVRLTPAQRCEKLGHNYIVNTVPATCTEDGYTVKNCRRCGDFVREAGANRLGHNYESKTVAPTCTEKGYTLMTCKNAGCDDSYITKYTPMIAHDYANTVVAPTCTAKGYTSHVCKSCGASYKDSYTEVIAHNYVNGKCTVCGKKSDLSADTNFYINFINSLSKADSYYVELSDVNFVLNTTMGEDAQKVTGKFETYRMQVGFDADGYIVGCGEGKVSFSMERDDEVESIDQNMTLAFKNKKLYIKTTQTTAQLGFKEVTEQNIVVSQDSEEFGAVKAAIENYYNAAAKKIIGAVLDAELKDNPLNKGITKVTEYLFDKAEAAGGYSLTLNYAHAAEVVKYLKENNAKSAFDALCGTGSFDELVKFVREFPDMTLKAFMEKVTFYANVYNLKMSDVYALVDSVLESVMPDGDITAASFVSANENKTMAQIIAEISGEMTAEQIKAAISERVDAIVPMLTGDMSVAELAYFFATGEQADPDTGIMGFIYSMLDKLNTAVNNTVKVVVYTDLSGAFEYATVKIDDFAFNAEIPAGMVSSQAGVIDVSADMSLVISSTPGTLGDNNSIVVAIDNAQSAFVSAVKSYSGAAFDGYVTPRGTVYYNFLKDGENTWLIPSVKTTEDVMSLVMSYNATMTNERRGEYNGAECVIYDLRIYNRAGYLLDFDGEYSYSKSCNGWTLNNVHAKYASEVYYTVYTKGSEVLAIVFDGKKSNDYVRPYDYIDNTRIYFNKAQGKFSLNEPHKYALVDKKDPVKCEETGYKKYRCTTCGYIHYEFNTMWHDTEYMYKLKPGATDCSEGVIEVVTCKRDGCTYRNEHELRDVAFEGGHAIYPKKIAVNSVCDTYIRQYVCACGKVTHGVYIEGECEFKSINWRYCGEDNEKGECTHGYAQHEIITYQCGVTACGFTYTEERIITKPDANCRSDRKYVYTVDGKKYEYIEYSGYNHFEGESVTTQEGDLSVRTYTCNNCRKKVRTEKYDSYGRWVYDFDWIEKSGWMKEFRGCDYVQYDLDENGNRGEAMREGIDHAGVPQTESKHSCTQPHERAYVCAVCQTNVRTEAYYYGHNFVYDEITGKHKCADCGMTNDIYAEGPIVLENLSDNTRYAPNGEFMIGYYLREYERTIRSVEVYTDYDEEGNGTPLSDITCDINPNLNIGVEKDFASGRVTVDKESVAAWFAENPSKSLTVVFVIDGRGDNSVLEIAITFTPEELASILAK